MATYGDTNDAAPDTGVPHMLTTVDNPYNPFTHWDEWLAWDFAAGYNTPGMLARITITSDELSDADQEQAIEDAINEIVRINALGIYKKISKES